MTSITSLRRPEDVLKGNMISRMDENNFFSSGAILPGKVFGIWQNMRLIISQVKSQRLPSASDHIVSVRPLQKMSMNHTVAPLQRMSHFVSEELPEQWAVGGLVTKLNIIMRPL